MKTVTVQSVLLNAASRAGLDGSSIDNLSTTTKTIMLSNLDIHLRAAWEFFDWPDLCATELRTVQEGDDGDLYLDLAQENETEMAAVFDIYQDNPKTHAAPRTINFWLDADKVRLPSGTPATVYVRYRTVPTEISATLATALTQTVPQFMSDYLKFMLTADLLTEDGQEDKSQVMQQRAENYLIGEMDKVTLQQRQPRRWSAKVGPY